MPSIISGLYLQLLDSAIAAITANEMFKETMEELNYVKQTINRGGYKKDKLDKD